jgi:hypothetical protein
MKNLIVALVALSSVSISVSAFAGAGELALTCQDSEKTVFVSVVDDPWGKRSQTTGFGGGADRKIDYQLNTPVGPKNKSITTSFLEDDASGTISAVAVQGDIVVHILASGLKRTEGLAVLTYSHAIAVSTGDHEHIMKTDLICSLEND